MVEYSVDFDYVVDATDSFKVTFTSHPSPSEGVSVYSWDFKDGNGFVSDATNPVYVFSQKGSYDVTLTVTYTDGSTATKTKPIDVVFKPSLDSGSSHSLYVTEDQVYVWGRNRNGQLGIGNTTDQNAPVTITDLNNKKIISASGGYAHSLALSSDGKVFTWGDNSKGQLGKGASNSSNNTVNHIPVDITDKFLGLTGGDKIIAVSAGEQHSLALSVEGKVHAWGGNEYGQVGDESNTQRTTPVDITGKFTALTGSDKIAVVSAGQYHSLALSTEGKVYAWGNNINGQLGNGTTTKSNVPVEITDKFPAGKIKYISAGYQSSFAISVDDKVYGWGKNDQMELGSGDNGGQKQHTPIDIPALSGKNIITINTQYEGNHSSYSVALGVDGTVYTWGNNLKGQLGNGTAAYVKQAMPTALSGLGKIVAIASGYATVIVLDENGALKGWGANPYGQVGDGTTTTGVRTPATITIP